MYQEHIAHMTCVCGEKIQILNEQGDDYDPVATETARITHQSACPRYEIVNGEYRLKQS